MPMEMRMKNYIDKTYHTFDDADRRFYDSLTSHDKMIKLKKQLKEIEKRKIGIINQTVKEFTTSGKTTPKF